MNYPITTTLNAIWKRGNAFPSEYNRLVRALQGEPFTKKDKASMSYLRHKHDEPIPLTFILESNGLSDALRSLCASTASNRDIRMLSISFARRVEHLDKTGTAKKLNDTHERFANGQATIGELKEAQEAARWAWEAAGDAARAARAAGAAALSAAYAARAAGDAAAWAADAAAWAALAAAWTAGDAAHAAAYAVDEAARESEREAQEELFIQMCNGEAEWQ